MPPIDLIRIKNRNIYRHKDTYVGIYVKGEFMNLFKLVASLAVATLILVAGILVSLAYIQIQQDEPPATQTNTEPAKTTPPSKIEDIQTMAKQETTQNTKNQTKAENAPIKIGGASGGTTKNNPVIQQNDEQPQQNNNEASIQNEEIIDEVVEPAEQ